MRKARFSAVAFDETHAAPLGVAALLSFDFRRRPPDEMESVAAERAR